MNKNQVLHPYTKDNFVLQLGVNAVAIIASTLYQFENCKFLIFGTGPTSAYWHKTNKNGRTVFLELDKDWAEKIKIENPELEIYTYSLPSYVNVKDSYTDFSKMPMIMEPKEMQRVSWDVILVDGPDGSLSNSPGRAYPILWAKKCATVHTHVFVNDYDRVLERYYCDKIFKNDLPTYFEYEALTRYNDKVFKTIKEMFWNVGIPQELFMDKMING